MASFQPYTKNLICFNKPVAVVKKYTFNKANHIFVIYLHVKLL